MNNTLLLTYQSPSILNQTLPNFQQLIWNEIPQYEKKCCEGLCERIESISQSLYTRIDELEQSMQEKMTMQLKGSKTNMKNISNKHPEVKVSDQSSYMERILQIELMKKLVHTMFWNIYNINLAKNKWDHTKVLTKPLESGEPYETIEDICVWQPDFANPLDQGINPIFIQELVDCILDDEKVDLPFFCKIRSLTCVINSSAIQMMVLGSLISQMSSMTQRWCHCAWRHTSAA